MRKKYITYGAALLTTLSALATPNSLHVFLKDGRVIEYTTDIVDSVVFTRAGESVNIPDPVIPSVTPTDPVDPNNPGEIVTKGGINIITVGGCMENIAATWEKVNGAGAYAVYVKNSTSSDEKYAIIDNPLIRTYGSYVRADIPGLAAGEYNVKIVALDKIGGSEISKPTVTKVSVTAHDRSGFAFSGSDMPGAYNADGTLKDNAVVLYLTEKTKNNVSLEVVTSSKGATTTANGIQNILTLYKKGYDSRPLCIRIIGNVTDPDVTDKGDILLDLGGTKQTCKGVTFEGIGEDAVANGWGIRIKNSKFVEVSNLGTMNCDSGEGDNIGLQQSNEYVWVHNCDFFYGDAGSDADQVKGDGALDCKKSTNITFSYNHFFDNGKCNLLGLSEGTTENLYITYHHNWYDHSDSRHPRVRYYSAHVYNNYYDGNAKYGIGSTLGSSIFSENNYFRSCKYPMLTSMQGSDLYASGNKRDSNNGTFSGEAGGSIKAYGNEFEGNCTYVAYGVKSTVLAGKTVDASTRGINTAQDFDFWQAPTKDAKMPESITSYLGGNKYNNFDTESNYITRGHYKPESAAQAKETVIAFAGRQNGGDFKWTFTSNDDESYAVNAALKSALTNYKTQLVKIQGE